MKRTDTDIHSIELLLTLDYLLNNTDKDHPATQTNIARYSKKYGLRYDPINQKGNDIKRQRLGKYLDFLKRLSDRFPNQVPFHISETESGKYYVDKKYYLDNRHIVNVISLIEKCDDFSQSEKEFVKDSLLKVFGNNLNRYLIEKQASKQAVEKQKYSKRVSRNLYLLKKALNEGKTITIFYGIDDLVECRVYKIKEFKHTPYVVLLPISDKRLYEIIFVKVALLSIPSLKESDILHDDVDDKRDLQKLYKKMHSSSLNQFDTLDEMIKEHKLIEGGNLTNVSFYFDLNFLEIVNESYEYYFSEQLKYQKCSVKELCDLTGRRCDVNNDASYGLVKDLSISACAFESWLLSDPFDNGLACICDFITLIDNDLINKYLACHFARHMSVFEKYLSEEDIKAIIDDLKK